MGRLWDSATAAYVDLHAAFARSPREVRLRACFVALTGIRTFRLAFQVRRGIGLAGLYCGGISPCSSDSGLAPRRTAGSAPARFSPAGCAGPGSPRSGGRARSARWRSGEQQPGTAV